MSERQDDVEEAPPGVPPEAFDHEDDVTVESMALVRARAGVTLADASGVSTDPSSSFRPSSG